MRSRFSFARYIAVSAPWASLFAFAACGPLLGIEQVHEGPSPGTGGEGGSGVAGANAGATSMHAGNGTGGGSAGKGSAGGSAGKGSSGDNAGGDTASAGAGGRVTNGGAGGGGAGRSGAGGVGTGGAAGASAGASAAGAAGTSGSGGAGPGGTVNGRVIDYWGHPVPNVPVQIGDTPATTNAQGAFTVTGVPAAYDVTLVADFTSSGRREIYGWAYQGLTRRDPTLQIYAGLPERSGNIIVTPTNAVRNSTRTLSVALGGPDGAKELTDVGDNGVQTTADWRGPATTQERAHGLLWQYDATSQLPTSYVGYDSLLVALSDTTDQTMINLNLAATATIPSGNINGTVTPAASQGRANAVFLHFTSGATIQLAADSNGPNTFSYLVPTLPNAGVTFAASEGASGQYAVVHKDGLAAGTSGISAAIPIPSKPLTPAPGATNVDGTTTFTFQAGAGSAGGYLVSIIAHDFYDGLFIVTTNKSFKIPVIVGGAYVPVSTHKYDWRVETHGNLATADAMAGPTGFLDEFSGSNGSSPEGPHTGDGSFTISQINQFTAK